MSELLVYVDASAVAKLILEESESAALRAWIDVQPDRVSSVLLKVEVPRAIRRSAAVTDRDVALMQAELAIAAVNLIEVDVEILRRAAHLDPARLRSLNAIHLATALSLPRLGGLVTYDRQMTEGARLAGLTVFAPGRDATV